MWNFKKAKKYVRKLKLQSKNEWQLYCKNKISRLSPKPIEIPKSPGTYKLYKKFWDGWGDWLGSFNKKGAVKGNKNAIGGF